MAFNCANAVLVNIYRGCFPFNQKFRKFRSEFKWKGPFRFVLTGILGPPLKVDHFDRLDRSDRNLPFHFHKLVSCLTSVNRRMALGNGTQNGKDHSARLARFNREMLFHFALVYLGWFDCPDCENGKAPRIYSNKRRGACLIFRASSAALIRGRHLFKN